MLQLRAFCTLHDQELPALACVSAGVGISFGAFAAHGSLHNCMPNFSSASGNSSADAGTARQAVAAVIKEVFGGQQSTLSRSAKKVLNAPSIGAQVNSW